LISKSYFEVLNQALSSLHEGSLEITFTNLLMGYHPPTTLGIIERERGQPLVIIF